MKSYKFCPPPVYRPGLSRSPPIKYNGSVAVYINGKASPAGKGATIHDLLKLAGRDPALTAVTVDGKFVPRSEYKKLAPPEGARVAAYELRDGG